MSQKIKCHPNLNWFLQRDFQIKLQEFGTDCLGLVFLLISQTTLPVFEHQFPFILDLPIIQTKLLVFFKQDFLLILDLPPSQTKILVF